MLKPDTKEWVILRVPYPMGFHSRGMDGRIDDPNAGWKGRGVYATYGADAMWHIEGGPKEKNNLVKFQMRPDPLARNSRGAPPHTRSVACGPERRFLAGSLCAPPLCGNDRILVTSASARPGRSPGPSGGRRPTGFFVIRARFCRAPGVKLPGRHGAGSLLPTAHTTGRPIDFDHASEVVQRFQNEATKWLYGLDEAARILSWAFFTLIPYTDKLRQTKALRQPHVLFKGPTGTGKTDLVTACAMAVDARFERIQGLPTYMPEDILGYETMVEQLDGTRRIHFKPGKFMAHIVLIDEDNRLTAKTKAAVLEGMEESSVTLASDYGNLGESKTIPLYPLSCDLQDIHGPRFFMVICTENVFGDEEGTFPNPVAQLDRTTMAINMNDPEDEADELKIVARNVVGKKVEKLTNLYEVLDIAHFIFDNVQMSDYAQQYKVRLIRSTRPHRVRRPGGAHRQGIRQGRHLAARPFPSRGGGAHVRLLQRRHHHHARSCQSRRTARAGAPAGAEGRHGVLGQQGRGPRRSDSAHGRAAVDVEEVFARFRAIKQAIRTPKRSNSFWFGEHRSAFQGSGFDIAGVDEWRPGQPLKDVAWRLSLRTYPDRLYKIERMEQKQIPTLLVVDLSHSTLFEISRDSNKALLLLDVIGAIGLTRAGLHDPVGLLAFSDRIELFVKPKLGTAQVFRIAHEIFEQAGTGTPVARQTPRRPCGRPALCRGPPQDPPFAGDRLRPRRSHRQRRCARFQAGRPSGVEA